MTEPELRIKIIEAFLKEPGMAFNYGYFEDLTGVTRESIKKMMDSLRKTKMVEYVRGLMDDDGNVAGSGFQLTYRATQWSVREWLVELKRINSEREYASITQAILTCK